MSLVPCHLTIQLPGYRRIYFHVDYDYSGFFPSPAKCECRMNGTEPVIRLIYPIRFHLQKK